MAWFNSKVKVTFIDETTGESFGVTGMPPDVASDVDAEIAKIRSIHENASAGVGWREIQVRTKPELPLNGTLRLRDLAKMLPGAKPVVGVTYRDANTQIIDGYALCAGEFTIYGVAPDGVVSVVAFDQYAELSQSDILNPIKTLARNSNLDLVDWCRCARLPPDDSRFDSIFKTTGT